MSTWRSESRAEMVHVAELVGGYQKKRGEKTASRMWVEKREDRGGGTRAKYPFLGSSSRPETKRVYRAVNIASRGS